jgi:hypothetical protein
MRVRVLVVVVVAVIVVVIGIIGAAMTVPGIGAPLTTVPPPAVTTPLSVVLVSVGRTVPGIGIGAGTMPGAVVGVIGVRIGLGATVVAGLL